MPASTADRLFDRLGKGKAPPVVVLPGADPYWRDVCRRKLEEALVPETARQWALGRVSAADVDAAEVVGRAQMQPMLAPQQVLFVGDAEAWEKGSDEKLDSTLKALTRYFEDPAPFTVLVLEAEKLDQRTRFARLLGEPGMVALDPGLRGVGAAEDEPGQRSDRRHQHDQQGAEPPVEA